MEAGVGQVADLPSSTSLVCIVGRTLTRLTPQRALSILPLSDGNPIFCKLALVLIFSEVGKVIPFPPLSCNSYFSDLYCQE